MANDFSLAPSHEQLAAAGRGCPKCGYRRLASDTAPPGQCPKCGIFYDKYRTGPAAERVAERVAERRRAPRKEVVVEQPKRWPWILLAAAIVAAAYGGWQYKRKPAKPSAEVMARLSAVDAAKQALQDEESIKFAWQRSSGPGSEPYLKTLREFADKGNTRAMVVLGMVHGRQDNTGRVQWWTKAANEGEAAAFVNLGYIYETGDGVRREPETAANWYAKAARQGNGNGLYALGSMYASGSDIGRNPRQAYLLFLLADRAYQAAEMKQDWLMPQRLTSFWAKGKASDLEKELSPVDVVKARELAEAWKDGQPLPKL